MPLYEFECLQCGAVYEELCKPGDMPACAKCSSHNVKVLPACPGPLKTGAFPYKIGPVHPMASKMAAGLNRSCGSGCCAAKKGCSGNGK